MKLKASRLSSNGTPATLYPFHVCMKGLENAVLYRDDDDYDAMTKIICVCAYRKNARVIIYAVVSNHSHVALLSRSQSEADAYAIDIKKMYSMWFRRKYNEANILHRVEIKAILMETEWHVRNTLAYIPRNALDNNCPIHTYPWSGYRAMFSGNADFSACRKVASLTFREKIAVMHTGDNLTEVPWLLDENGHLIPSTFCDCEYLEQAFENDPAYFLKTIGSLNPAEMRFMLEEKPYTMQTDSEYLKSVEQIARRWFQTGLESLSLVQKIRLIPYLYRTSKTSIPQLARVMGVDRDRISSIVRKT